MSSNDLAQVIGAMLRKASMDEVDAIEVMSALTVALSNYGNKSAKNRKDVESTLSWLDDALDTLTPADLTQDDIESIQADAWIQEQKDSRVGGAV